MELRVENKRQRFSPQKQAELAVTQIGVVANPEDIVSLAKHLTHRDSTSTVEISSKSFVAASWAGLQRKVPVELKGFVEFIRNSELETFGRLKSFITTRETSLSVSYCPKAPTSLYEAFYMPAPEFMNFPDHRSAPAQRCYSTSHPFDATYVVGNDNESVHHTLGNIQVPFTLSIQNYNKKLNSLFEQGRISIVTPARGAICVSSNETISRKYSEEEASQDQPYASITLHVRERRMPSLLNRLVGLPCPKVSIPQLRLLR